MNATWPQEHVILLGQLVGDGSYLKGQPLRYATASEDNSSAVRTSAESLGATVRRYKGRGHWHQLLISGNGNRWHASGVGKWLKELGIYGQRDHEKRLPAKAFELSNEQVALLLRHLWATDGSITPRRPGGKGRHTVHFSTSSPGLAGDVADLLRRFGIAADIASSTKRASRPCHHVTISGQAGQRAFLDYVGAFGPSVRPAAELRILLDAAAPGN
jgi:replicative DNA helicase